MSYSHKTRQSPLSSENAFKNNQDKTYMKDNNKQSNRVLSSIPIGMGIVAAITVGLNGAGEAVGGLEGHIGGSFALQIVNSSNLQVTLAGITWYLIGLYIIQVVERVGRRD